MTAPESIRVAQDADGFWTCREAVSGSQEYVRADLYTALEAQLAERAGGVKVRELEWKTLREGESYAAVGAGITYRLVKAALSSTAWSWYRLEGHQQECESFEAARAAAQADYEQRIRSALVDVPVEPVAWQYFNDGAWRHSTNPEYHRTTGYEMRPLFAHPPLREGEDSAEVVRLRGLLDVALDALDSYADPTGYTDNNGEQLAPDEVVHQGLLAKETAANLRSALTTEPAAPEGRQEPVACECTKIEQLERENAELRSQARREALEEAAKVASPNYGPGIFDGYENGRRDAAAAIRRFAEQEAPEAAAIRKLEA
jgi:hypothetical protein